MPPVSPADGYTDPSLQFERRWERPTHNPITIYVRSESPNLFLLNCLITVGDLEQTLYAFCELYYSGLLLN